MYTNLVNAIGSVISASYNTLANVITNLSDFIATMPSKIWNLFKVSFDNVVSILENIKDFFVNFFEVLFEFIKKIFVPHETYFSDKLNSVGSAFSEKFKFISQIDNVFNTVQAQKYSVDSLKITFPKYKINIDFSWYEPYRARFKNALMGFFSLIFIAGVVKRNDPKINMGGN